MERTTHTVLPKNGKRILTQEDIAMLGSIVARSILGGRLGMQYGGDRNLYEALGYPGEDQIQYRDYLQRYRRQDIAKAIIDRPVRATWQGTLDLIETNDDKETTFEAAWKELNDRLKLKVKFARVDKLAGIGRYAVLMLGFDDVKKQEDFALPVDKPKQLLYVKPIGEGNAKITTYIGNPTDPRYSMPEYYSLEVTDMASNRTTTVKVHWSRVLHIVTDTLESEIEGTPVLEAVFNRLMDLEKVVGGDAEMFWRNARPGYKGKVDKDYSLTPQMEADLKIQQDEYEHNLRRFLMAEGVDIEALTQVIADPASHVDILLQMISAVTGIPKRILTGSERGELSSAQDTEEWTTCIQARRAEHAEMLIVRPFVDYCIKLSILPKPQKTYTVDWPDLFALSEKARVEIGKSRANALREYVTMPMAEAIVPPDAFLEFFCGFTQPQIELMKTIRDKQFTEEELTKMLDELLIAPPQVPIAGGGQPNPIVPKPKPIRSKPTVTT